MVRTRRMTVRLVAPLLAILWCTPILTGVALAGAPTGACCFATGACEELPSFICEDQEGTFIGNDTTCDLIACEAPLAVPMLSIFGLVSAVGMLGGFGLYRLLFRSR